MEGYVYIHRKIMEHEVYKNAELYKLFSTLIMMAAWRDYTLYLKGKKISIKRGQLFISKRDLFKELNYSHRSGRRYLSDLEKIMNTITITKYGQKMLISIINYDKYQNKKAWK